MSDDLDKEMLQRLAGRVTAVEAMLALVLRSMPLAERAQIQQAARSLVPPHSSESAYGAAIQQTIDEVLRRANTPD